MGVRDPLLTWIQSFLSSRSQVVQIQDSTSSPRPITSGVIQGSVLGPALFLAYMNDICGCFTSGQAFLFADDLKVVYTTPRDCISRVIHLIEADLTSLESWCAEWLMDFNSEKCGILTNRCVIPTRVPNTEWIPITNSSKCA